MPSVRIFYDDPDAIENPEEFRAQAGFYAYFNLYDSWISHFKGLGYKVTHFKDSLTLFGEFPHRNAKSIVLA